MQYSFSIVIDVLTEIEMTHRLYQNIQFAWCSLTFSLNDMSIVPFPHNRSNELIVEVNHSQIVNCYLKPV